jgi:hypothetical protein
MNQHDSELKGIAKHWRNIYIVGAVFTCIALAGIILDVVIGNITGGNLSELPQNSIGRIEQLQTNVLLGLYNLDFINLINQVLLIPGFYALCMAHRKVNKAFSYLALLVSMIGSIVFIMCNPALPMLELSKKFSLTTDVYQMGLLAAAGEAFLARGEHGSMGALLGFVLPNLGGLLISILMLQNKIFSKVTAIMGIIGSSLIILYLFLVTFAPQVKTMATLFAMPGGLFLLAWMILFTIKLFKLEPNSLQYQKIEL